jgi:hypothetical protein
VQGPVPVTLKTPISTASASTASATPVLSMQAAALVRGFSAPVVPVVKQPVWGSKPAPGTTAQTTPPSMTAAPPVSAPLPVTVLTPAPVAAPLPTTSAVLKVCFLLAVYPSGVCLRQSVFYCCSIVFEQ